MPDQSPRLQLPFVQPSQAQKHVTHNEALLKLDALVQLTVESFGTTTPPALPQDGEVYALGVAPTGDWAGQDGMLAVYKENAWSFIAPQDGWRAWGKAEENLQIYFGGSWDDLPVILQNIDGVGVKTTSDATNRLAVASPASLFSHDGAGHQLKINKAATADTASLLYQSNWGGRAEMGLTGDDDFHIKVSPDGTNWIEALKIRNSDGNVTGSAVQSDNEDTTSGRLLKMTSHKGPFGLGSGRTLVTSGSLNDVQDGGVNRFLNWNAAATDVPWNYGVGMQFMSFDTTGNQLAFKRGANPAMAFRGTVSSAPTFSDWVEVFHTKNAVGSVSNPPDIGSAIVERGANANGEYVRFIDGTQICTHSLATPNISSAEGAGYKSSTAPNWIFPAGFAAGTLPILSGSINQGGGAWTSHFCNNTSSASFRAMSFTSKATSQTIYVSAIGRWF